MKITSFRGRYAFLSNFYPSPIKLGGITYTCAEAAFQAVKLADKSKRRMFSGLSGAEARKLGRQIKLRPDWEDIKIDVMVWIVHEKFMQNTDLRKRLLEEVRGNEIEEGNTWGDTFWGVCNGKGKNLLGQILENECYRKVELCKDCTLKEPLPDCHEYNGQTFCPICPNCRWE